MPNYQFKCEKCDEIFFEVKPLNESSELAECPKCNSKEYVRKVWGEVAIGFKGAGWTRKRYIP